MKKWMTVVCVCILVLTLASCKKTPTDDIYSDVVTEVASDDEVIAPVEDVIETPSTDDGTTVTDDVYAPDSEMVSIEDIDVGEVTAESVNDPHFQEQLLVFIERFYYNIFFNSRDMTVAIQQNDMIKFAISYVYQFEHQELKFDTTTFVLYVPHERVEELVLKYFDRVIVDHKSFEAENIIYEDGYYLMPAVDISWNETLKIEKVTKAGDFTFDVVFSVYDDDAKYVKAYMATVEISNNRFILTKYVPTEFVPSTNQ